MHSKLENGIITILCKLHAANVLFYKRGEKAHNRLSYSCLFLCLLEKAHGPISPWALWGQIHSRIHPGRRSLN